MTGHDDTIVAPATPPGPAARSIVRTSGPAAFDHAAAVARDPFSQGPNAAILSIDGLSIPATLYVFRGPRSHTGEDVVEYHVPGGDLVTRMLIDALIGRGCRLAEPGEFTGRAFFNGKLRLDEAEAVQATIAARSDAELAAASRLRGGELARRLAGPMDAVATLLARCEAGIDFADEEDVVVLPADEAVAILRALRGNLDRLLASASRFEQLARLPTVALVGRPNAGKSTLMNTLVGHSRAVVAAERGTTRDAVTNDLHLSAGTVRLLDSAGVGDGAVDALDDDAQRIALAEAAAADVLVLLRAADDSRPDPDLPRPADLRLTTKADLAAGGEHRVSAASGEGIDALRDRLSAAAFQNRNDAGLTLNARHVAAVREATQSLQLAAEAFAKQLGDEVAALDLRAALDALGSVLGDVTPDDVLGRIFSTFCVGK